MKHKTRGFTLIEMMIVVAVIALLATIAFPSYQNFTMRNRRADGKDLAMRIASAQERHYTNRNVYTDDPGVLGVNPVSEQQYYTAQIVVPADGQSYTLNLIPQDVQANDRCGTLTINNTGYKDKLGPGGNGSCW